jgi:hypothetical protein
MLQMDGSHHDWFEGRGPRCVLMVIVDDATSRTWARFYPAETTGAAFDAFGRWAGRHGLPRSLYVDRHSIYRDEGRPQKPTQFGRAMAELGVQLICAHSPQAKGRVERKNAVFQDRLVKELRLRGISDMAQANALLEASFLDDLNRRYAIDPADDQDLHRALAGLVLGEVLCVRQERAVGQDWCVRWDNRWLQVGAAHAALRLPRRRVLVRELADGRLLLEYRGQRLSFTELPARPARRPERRKKVIVNNRRWKPDKTHPWNRGPAVGPRPSVNPAPATPARDSRTGRKKAG